MNWSWIFVLVGAGMLVLAGGFGYAGRRAYTKYQGHGGWDGEELVVAASALAIVGLLVGIIPSTVAGMDQAACSRYGRSLGVETEWGLVGGCYVAVGDRLVPQSWIVPVVEGELLRIEVIEGG
jgi:hypothetical protein